MKKLAATLATFALIAFPQSGIANGFVTNTAGAKIFIFTGLSPDQSIPIKIVGWPRDKATVPNACGLTVVAPSTGATILQIATASSMINVASLPVQTVPTCSAGVLAEPRTANFKTSTGSVVLVGQAAGSIRIIQDITRNIKSNGCGIARLSPPKQTFAGNWWLEGTSFIVGGQTLYSDDLLGTPEQSICKTVGGQKVKYVPLNPAS